MGQFIAPALDLVDSWIGQLLAFPHSHYLGKLSSTASLNLPNAANSRKCGLFSLSWALRSEFPSLTWSGPDLAFFPG